MRIFKGKNQRMDSEKKESLNWDVLKRLRPYIKPYRLRLGSGILFGILYGAASFGLLAALGWATGLISGEDLNIANSSGIPSIPQGGEGKLELNQVIKAVALLPIVAILQGLIFFAGKYFVEWVGNRIVADLRLKLFNHIHTLPMQFFTQSRSGELISRITNDTGILTGLVANVIADAIRAPFTLIGSIAIMFWRDWQLSIIALVVFPICIAPIALISRRIRKAAKTGQESMGDLLSVVQESIGGAVVVKAFQMEQEEEARFHQFNTKVFKMTMRQTRGLALGEPLMTGASAIGLAGIVVYAYMNDLSLAVLVTFGAAMINMYKPAKKLSQLHMQVNRAVPSAERIFEIIDTQNTISDTPEAVPFQGTVESVDFKNVSFAYDDKKILDGINLEVRAGQCIALVGSSGAGKTTMVNLIPRFFDATEGSVELNGKDLRDYTVQSLRKQIGIVTQQTILFNQSVADNISYGSREATREQIETAAKRANAHAFIMEMEHGYDTVIGERAALLSGGMAQRVAIARALLRNPPILILDEATSALDNESERLVQGALNELMKKRTVFVIAHRLSTIAHADSIVVMDQGKIVEQGTHAELLKQEGQYKYFYDMQFAPHETNEDTAHE
jgi:subfamily B ATP-binding cassette protein MsbA